MTAPEPLHVFVTGVCSKDLRPSVLIEIGSCKVQVNADKAREIAAMILAAAEASISDAFVVGFFMKVTGEPIEKIGHIISEFREFRELTREKSEGL